MLSRIAAALILLTPSLASGGIVLTGTSTQIADNGASLVYRFDLSGRTDTVGEQVSFWGFAITLPTQTSSIGTLVGAGANSGDLGNPPVGSAWGIFRRTVSSAAAPPTVTFNGGAPTGGGVPNPFDGVAPAADQFLGSIEFTINRNILADETFSFQYAEKISTLAPTGGGIAPDGFVFDNTGGPGGGGYNPLTSSFSGGNFSLTAVPEPSSLALLSLAGVGLLARKRRIA